MKKWKVTITRTFDYEGYDEDEVADRLCSDLLSEGEHSGLAEWLSNAEYEELT